MEKWIVEIGAILILGFIIWVGTKTEILWKHFHVSAFLVGHKKIILLTLAILLLTGGSWMLYNQHQELRWKCLEKIQYQPHRGGFYEIESATSNNPQFKTRGEALDYCLSEPAYRTSFRSLNLSEYPLTQ